MKIDAEKLKAEIERQQRRLILLSNTEQVGIRRDCALQNGVYDYILDIITSLQQEQPEPYFYCKYGGTIPLCSDCKRNHSNSSFKTEEITTWYAPSNGTKHCADYIQKEQPEIDLEKEIDKYCEPIQAWQIQEAPYTSIENCARHFYELGRKGGSK